MNRMYHAGMFVAVLFGCTMSASAQAFTLTVIAASGAVSAPPGGTAGWGYQVSNPSSSQWLVVTGISASGISNGTPDSSFFDFPIVPPLGTATKTFSTSTHTGLYGITWNPSAPVGFAISGQFSVSAEWWSGDPLLSGSFIADAVSQISDYAAAVSGASSSIPVITDSVFVLAGMLLAAAGCRLLQRGTGVVN
jgi:hypothetical protein